MLEGEPSQTAIGVARIRAAHQVLDDEPRILEDPVAVGLVPGSTPEDIRDGEARFQSPILRAIRAILVWRARCVEDALAEAAATGAEQFVILGAGLDTFAYRQPQWAEKLTLFEVDHPATQSWKKAMLKLRSNIRVPSNLRFCPVDFENTSLREGLANAAFDFDAVTFISWLGVSQYLTSAAIDETLALVLDLSAGSSIAFTFIVPDRYLASEDRELKAIGAESASRAGEPWLSEYASELLTQNLLKMGFSNVVHISDEAANERYFRGREDGLRAPGYEHMMLATV